MVEREHGTGRAPSDDRLNVAGRSTFEPGVPLTAASEETNAHAAADHERFKKAASEVMQDHHNVFAALAK